MCFRRLAQRRVRRTRQSLEALSLASEETVGTSQHGSCQMCHTQMRHIGGPVPAAHGYIEADRFRILGRTALHASRVRAEEAKQVRPRRHDDAFNLVASFCQTSELDARKWHAFRTASLAKTTLTIGAIAPCDDLVHYLRYKTRRDHAKLGYLSIAGATPTAKQAWALLACSIWRGSDLWMVMATARLHHEVLA